MASGLAAVVRAPEAGCRQAVDDPVRDGDDDVVAGHGDAGAQGESSYHCRLVPLDRPDALLGRCLIRAASTTGPWSSDEHFGLSPTITGGVVEFGFVDPSVPVWRLVSIPPNRSNGTGGQCSPGQSWSLLCRRRVLCCNARQLTRSSRE